MPTQLYIFKKQVLFRVAITCCLCFVYDLSNGQKITVEFVRYADGTALSMDIYEPDVKTDKPGPVILHLFGGGFVRGSRTDGFYRSYIKFLNSKGFSVAAIDYRLGLKGITKPPSVFHRKPLINAILMGVEDTFSATKYLIQHAKELGIDTSKIILSGCSAGGVIVLRADYEKRNHDKHASMLPASFQYAGVISFAGALYSTEGKPDYDSPPSPMLLFHGTADDISPYKKISLFGTGLFGSKVLAKKRKKDNYPYCFYSFEGIGHDACFFPMNEYQPQIYNFIQEYILEERPLFIDVTIKDPNRRNRSGPTLQQIYRRQKAS